MRHTLKLIIAFTVVALLVSAGVVGYFYYRNAQQEPETGTIEGALYPCTWAIYGGKSCEISIGGELPENAVWSIISSGAAEAEQKGDSALFAVKPLKTGTATVMLQLRDGGVPGEIGADFNFDLTVDENKKLRIDTAFCTPVKAEVYRSESGAAICWRESDTGSIFINLPGTSWTAGASKGASVLGPTQEGDNMRLEVIASGDEGRRTVLLHNGEDGESIRISFEYKAGALSVTDCSAAETMTPEEYAEYIKNEYAERYEAETEKTEDAEETEEEAKQDGGMSTLDYAIRKAKLRDAVKQFTEENGREPTEWELRQLETALRWEN